MKKAIATIVNSMLLTQLVTLAIGIPTAVAFGYVCHVMGW